MRFARWIFLAVALLAPFTGVAQPVVSEPAAELGEIAFQQALKDLSNDLRLLCVAAHPDDEDGATLAYHRFKHGIETHVLICTRGEGGQNEIGPELYEDLAVIRTKEMQEAAKIEGAQLHFLDMPEFGYSKTLEETLEVWGEEELVRRMVRKIREIRPHVIITHHGKMKDHGHHQAVGWALKKAFRLAGDSDYITRGKRYVDARNAILDPPIESLSEYLILEEPIAPWQPLRLYVRDFTGTVNGAKVIDISERDPARGKPYAEIHADALRAHSSQGMGFIIDRLLSGEPEAYYIEELNVTDTELTNDDLLEQQKSFGRFGIDASLGLGEFPLKRVSVDPSSLVIAGKDYGPLFEGAPIYNEALDRPTIGGTRDDLLEALCAAAVESPDLWHANDVKQSNLLQAACYLTGTTLEFEPLDPVVVPGQLAEFRLSNTKNPDVEPSLRLSLILPGHYVGRNKSEVVPMQIDEQAEPSLPKSHYILQIDTAAPSRYTQTELITAKVRSLCDKYLMSKEIDLARIRLGNVDIAPPVLPEFIDAPYLFRHGVATEISVPVKLTNYTPGAHTQTVTFGAPEGWTVEPAAVDMEFAREDEQKVITLTVRAPEGVAPGSYTITADTEKLGFTEEAQVAVVDFAPPPGDPLIGIVDSYDVQFRAAMDKLGVRWEAVTEQDFTPERLDRYDVLLVDMRSYLYRPDLKANNAAALAYVERGGTMIVNYHKTFDWAAEFAPHRLVLSNNRVTREDAPVTLREPQHPVWNTPNAIGPADWEGWRQERGLYFAGEWDDAFTPLLETSDPDEVIPPGAMLIADHGEGKYLYTALVWYRQLRELNPGAVRIFANMLAL